MAGRHLHFSSSFRERPLYTSRSCLFSLSILSLVVLLLIFSLSSSSSPSFSTVSAPNPRPDFEYSFVTSLERFLSSHLGRPPSKDDTVVNSADDDGVLSQLDDAIWRVEKERIYEGYPSIYPASSMPLSIYVYEMPPKFTYDLLWLFHKTYKETDNLTSNGSPVHRLIEQHSIDYWLWRDLISPESERLLKNVVRVHRQEEADFFYVPFFTTISFFLLETQHCKALYRV